MKPYLVDHIEDTSGNIVKENVKADALYCIKQWKLFYLLENEELIRQQHELKRLV